MMKMFKGVKSLAVALLLAGSTTNAQFNKAFEAGGFDLAASPGMGLRIQQHTIDDFKVAMQQFFPGYFVADMKLPKEFHYQINFLWDYLTWNIDWTDITYDKPEFDFQDIKFRMTDAYDRPQIIVDFPALESFHMHAKQNTDAWWIPDGDTISVDFDDFDVDFSCSLHINQQGNLRPVFYTFHMKFGDSYVYHENIYLKFVMHQILEFGMIMVENTAYFCGELILSQIGEPVLTTFLQDYKLNLNDMPSPFLGQTELTPRHNYIFDWRMTTDPIIYDGMMDLKMVGNIWSTSYGECQMAPDPFDFMQHTIASQLVVTESAMECMMNNMAMGGSLQMYLNETKTNELFNTTGIKTDTSSIAQHLPLFQQKIGPNKPLLVKLNAKDFKITFGQFDCDMILDYTLDITVFNDQAEKKSSRGKKDDSKKKNNELFHDEIKFVTSLDMETDNDDIAHIKILEHKLNRDSAFSGRQLPVRNGLKITKNEYREFMSTLGFTAKYFKDWLNSDEFKGGIALPFNLKEFKTDVKFQDKSMHMFFEIESDFAGFLRKELQKQLEVPQIQGKNKKKELDGKK